MNSTERDLRIKYRYSKTPYIYDVYEEFELRCNATQEDYEGLKRGECRFNYDNWETRLNISRKQMQRAISNLTKEDKVIKQTFKGLKGKGSSIYFLTRFEDNKKDNKKDNNEDNKKASKIKALKVIKDNKQDNNYDSKKVNTSKHNNLNIISKEIYSEITEQFNSTCIGLSKVKKITDKRKSAIEARLKEYDKETIYEVFDLASNSNFLNGKSDRGWKADFDWIFNPNNFIKVLEGNYNNHEQQSTEKSEVKIGNPKIDYSKMTTEEMIALGTKK